MDSEGDCDNQHWRYQNMVWNDSGGLEMKKTIAFLLMLLLLFSCSACGKDDQRNEGSGDSETEQQQPQDDDVQSEDSTDAPGKIVLDGTPVRWDEFPMPTAETLGLPGRTLSFTMRLLKFITQRFMLTHSVSPQKM